MPNSKRVRPVTLYGYATSPYVWKVNCYIAYKQIDFSFVDVNPLTSAEISFTGQGQVPVLTIGDQWRIDPLTTARWLEDEFAGPALFPESRLLPEVMKIEDWVTSELIPSLFRQLVDWERWSHGLRNGWTLAQIVHDGTPLPPYIRVAWPLALRRTDFIIAYANSVDRTRSLPAMQDGLASQLAALLGHGPFLGQASRPTLADLSAFPIVAGPYMLGLRGDSLLEKDSRLREWTQRVAQHLPANPLPCADRFIKQPL